MHISSRFCKQGVNFEVALSFSDSGELFGVIPIPRSSPKIMTSAGKGRLPSRKKTRKASLFVHLSPKPSTNETMSVPQTPSSVESYANSGAGETRVTKKLEKRSVFQGNKHGICEGGVTFVPAIASSSHKGKISTTKSETSALTHEQIYEPTPSSYSVSTIIQVISNKYSIHKHRQMIRFFLLNNVVIPLIIHNLYSTQ